MAPRSPIPPTGVARPGCPRPRRLRVALVAAVVLGAGLGTVQQAATPRPAGAAATSWPLHWSVDTPGWNRSSSPVIADIDGDGANEVVVGHQDGILRAYEGDGSLRWATAAVPGIGAGCRAQSGPTAVDSSPAVADLDGDGTAEVIVGLGSTWRSGQNGSLLVLDGPSGAIEWRWAGGRDRDTIPANTGVPDGWCDGVFTTPAVADVDGDGSLDIVFAGWDFNIWAVDHTGTALAGFPFDNDD
ncbi:MAG: FG-GAP-like repeat-containing protein, partial [Acidimicrobiales bacterium]